MAWVIVDPGDLRFGVRESPPNLNGIGVHGYACEYSHAGHEHCHCRLGGTFTVFISHKVASGLFLPIVDGDTMMWPVRHERMEDLFEVIGMIENWERRAVSILVTLILRG